MGRLGVGRRTIALTDSSIIYSAEFGFIGPLVACFTGDGATEL